MKIYNHHPQTGEFLNQSEASLDPIEQKPMVPAFATELEPPEVQDNEKAVFVDGAWQVISDYRETEYWLEDGSHTVIAELGATPPEDALFSPPMASLKEGAKKKVAAFSADARAKLAGHADQYKLAGWNDKSQRAQRVIANTASDADIAILQTECDKRGKGETPQGLALKQAAKGQALAQAVAVIDGMESAALEAIASKRSENTLSALLDQLQTEANAELNRLLGG